MQKKKVLIVGGAGYIGSIVNKMLSSAGYDTVVFDNLSTGRREAVTRGQFVLGDMADKEALETLFTEHRFDAVMHFAALIDVGESVKQPAKYYQNNVVNTLNLLNTMERHGVDVFIFSSSAAIFGIPEELPITEDCPSLPINPYGESKWMVECILRDLSHAGSLRYSALRYFNAAGGDPDGEIKNSKLKESNLIPLALRSQLSGGAPLRLFGSDYETRDGTCIRDYIHICDLATAHIAAMERLLAGNPSRCYNLGNGRGFTVREVLKVVEKITGKPLHVIESARREGDPPVLIACAERARKELNWQPSFPDLESIVQHAWDSLSIIQLEAKK